MNELWIAIVSVLFVTLGLAAELNLFMIFVRDWREGQCEDRAKRFRGPTQERGIPKPTARWTLTRRVMAASFSAPAWLAAAAFGQVASQPTALEGTTNSPVPDRSGLLALSGVRFSLSFQPGPATEPPQAPAANPPLTISTNRPSFNDTTGIVPIGHFQFETGYTFTFRDRDGTETQAHNAPELFGRIPLLEDRLELQLGTSGYLWSRSESGSGFESTQGFSDVTLGFRLKVVDEQDWRPRIALQVSTTTGIGTDGISNQDVEPTFKLLWSYTLKDGWGIYGTAAVGYLTSGSDRFVQGQGGVCLTKTLNEKWSLFGEYYVFGPNSKGTDAAHYVDVGAAYLITPRIQLDARVGFGLNEEANSVFTGFGISFLF